MEIISEPKLNCEPQLNYWQRTFSDAQVDTDYLCTTDERAPTHIKRRKTRTKQQCTCPNKTNKKRKKERKHEKKHTKYDEIMRRKWKNLSTAKKREMRIEGELKMHHKFYLILMSERTNERRSVFATEIVGNESIICMLISSNAVYNPLLRYVFRMLLSTEF